MTDKERLEELIEELPLSIRYAGETEELFAFARDLAERVQELENEYRVRQTEYLEEHIDRLEKQNKRYREALERIANEKITIVPEFVLGKVIMIAKVALEGEE